MIALLIIAVITILTIAQFYLKGSVFTSFATVIAAIFGVVIAFNYYELLADQLISRGYLGQWAQAGCLFLLFVVGFAALRSLVDFILNRNIDFNPIIKTISSIVFGAVTGIILSGVLLITLALSPLSQKMSYTRFDGEVSASNKLSPKSPPIKADAFVTGLFSWLSRGSLSSNKSFAVLHSNFLDQIHLNRLALNNNVDLICSINALRVPPANLKPVRTMELDGRTLTVVRASLAARKISSGGAIGPNKKLSLSLSQVRLICKKNKNDNLRGFAEAVWPMGILENNQLREMSLGDIIEPKGPEITGGVYSADYVFEVRGNQMPVLLQFKQNAMVELPPTAASTEELEKALNEADSNSR